MGTPNLSKIISKIAGLIVIVIGIAVLIGWMLDVPVLRSLYPDFEAMKPSSAISFILSGLCLWYLNYPKEKKNKILVWRLCALAIIIISGFTFIQDAFDLKLGIDPVFIKEQTKGLLTDSSVRMAPATSVNFLFLGLSFLLFSRVSVSTTRIIVSMIVPISIFAFLNYLSNSQSLLYPENFRPITFFSSITFVITAIGFLLFLSTEKQEGIQIFQNRFHHIWQPYAVAIIIVSIAAALRLWPLQSLGPRTVWVTFYPSVMLVAIYGGFAAGLLATFFSSFIALFLWPIFVDQPFIKDFGDWLSMLVFIVTCVTISSVAEATYRAREKVKRTNKQLAAVNIEFEKEIETRQIAEKEIIKLNKELEQRVLNRTEELEKTNLFLRKSEERFRSTLDNMLEGCQILGFDWSYIYLNDSADRHNRRPKEELLGKKYTDMWPGIEYTEVYRIIKSCMEERITHHMENEFEFPDKSKGWFELSIQPVPEGVFILSYDISERKKSEQDLLKLNLELEQRVAERTNELEVVNKELEAFTYSVSHDLRAPLRHISGFVQLLNDAKDSNLDDKSIRYLNIIADSAKQMGKLIDDLLYFSRMGRASLRYSVVDFNYLMNQIINEIENSADYKKVEWELAQLPSVQADFSLMKVVFVNLLSNAVKYSSKMASPKIQIGYNKTEESKVVFYVKDNGAGFDMHYAHKLFGVFQRLHGADEFEGTGIGLA
ncbi:MAG: histidine kinase dimerization/phospho-acceptor domain-containing protein, partial [Melioribacteraceae bacterium]